MKGLLFFILLAISFDARALVPNLAQVQAVAKERGLARDLRWTRLLHLKKSAGGEFHSEIDGPGFFLDAQGSIDPQAELDADLSSLFTSSLDLNEEQSFQCRFPARNAFFKAHLPELSSVWPDRPCPRYRNWFETLRGVSVSLVFSSYYLNNPSSAFGHTFLRINKAPSEKTGERFELLDYGVNYAANADQSNALTFAFKGLFGGFPGVFTVLPYYYKVREYNNAESRDLWQYELNLAPGAADLLVAHVWELGPTSASYWYLTNNCSYFVLTLLEAADPHLHLTDHEKKFVIPTDTVQAVWNTPGLVRTVTYRPSTRTELFERLENLETDQKIWVSRTVDRLQVTPGLEAWSEKQRRQILDASLDAMDYRYPVPVQVRDSEAWKFKNQLLALRSQISEISQPLKMQAPDRERPDQGHGSRRWGLGVGSFANVGSFALLDYRFALHDYLDPGSGYPEYAQLLFFDFSFASYLKDHHSELRRLTLFEVDSLTPRTPFTRSPSWNLQVGFHRLEHPDCPSCSSVFVAGGLGQAVALANDAGRVGYLGLKASLDASASGGAATTPEARDFPRQLLAVGPHLVLKNRWNEAWVSLFEAWYRKEFGVNLNENKELSFATQWSPSKEWGLRLTGVEKWYERSALLESYFYY